jgi:hypothetical protein
MYDAGTESESFEWYRVRGAPKSECRLMQQRIDILALPHPPAAAAPSAAPSRAPAAAAARRPGGRKGARALLRGLRWQAGARGGYTARCTAGQCVAGGGVWHRQWMLTKYAVPGQQLGPSCLLVLGPAAVAPIFAGQTKLLLSVMFALVTCTYRAILNGTRERGCCRDCSAEAAPVCSAGAEAGGGRGRGSHQRIAAPGYRNGATKTSAAPCAHNFGLPPGRSARACRSVPSALTPSAMMSRAAAERGVLARSVAVGL